MMDEDDTDRGTDRGTERDADDYAAYYRSRACWHETRADLAVEASTQALHRRFARLYHERAASPFSTSTL